MKKHHETAGGVLFDTSLEKIYLVYKVERDEWLLPKGHIEDGESVISAAKREVYEETGYSDFIVLGNSPTEVLSFEFKGGKEQKTIYVFTLVLFSDRQIHTAERVEEGLGGKWFKVKEALEKVAHDDAKKAIRSAYEKIKDCRNN